VTKRFSAISILSVILALAMFVPALAHGQAQVPGQGGTGGNAFTCGGSYCYTPDAGWNPLDSNAALQTTGAMLVRALNGSKLFFGTVSQDVTLSTGGTTTVTSTPTMLPAGSIILAVNGTVTTTITGSCTGWEFGDGTTAARFTSNNTTLTAGSNSIGINQWNQISTASAQPGQPAAGNITVTCAGGAPTAGKIRITTFYLQPIGPSQ